MGAGEDLEAGMPLVARDLRPAEDDMVVMIRAAGRSCQQLARGRRQSVLIDAGAKQTPLAGCARTMFLVGGAKGAARKKGPGVGAGGLLCTKSTNALFLLGRKRQQIEDDLPGADARCARASRRIR